jgi:hypothetical protein
MEYKKTVKNEIEEDEELASDSDIDEPEFSEDELTDRVEVEPELSPAAKKEKGRRINHQALKVRRAIEEYHEKISQQKELDYLYEPKNPRKKGRA